MLCLHAGRRRTLDRVQPIQIVWILAPCRVLPHQLVEARITRAGEEIRIERQNYVGISQRVNSLRTVFECRPGDRWIILRELRLGILRQQFFYLPRQRWRGNGAAQEVNPCPIFAGNGGFAQFKHQLGEFSIFPAIGRML